MQLRHKTSGKTIQVMPGTLYAKSAWEKVEGSAKRSDASVQEPSKKPAPKPSTKAPAKKKPAPKKASSATKPKATDATDQKKDVKSASDANAAEKK